MHQGILTFLVSLELSISAGLGPQEKCSMDRNNHIHYVHYVHHHHMNLMIIDSFVSFYF